MFENSLMLKTTETLILHLMSQQNRIYLVIRHEVSPRQGHAGVPWNHAKERRIHLQVQLEYMLPKSSWSGVLLLWIPPGKDNFFTKELWAFWGPIRMSLLFIVQHLVFVIAACPDAILHTHRWKLWFDRLQRSRISRWKIPFLANTFKALCWLCSFA